MSTGLDLRRAQAASAISYLPRMLVGAMQDLHSIAESARVLPEVAVRLAAIQGKVDSMDGEVAQMRRAVEEVRGEVDGLRKGVGRIEPHLDEVRGALRPLRRATERARRLAGR